MDGGGEIERIPPVTVYGKYAARYAGMRSGRLIGCAHGTRLRTRVKCRPLFSFWRYVSIYLRAGCDGAADIDSSLGSTARDYLLSEEEHAASCQHQEKRGWFRGCGWCDGVVTRGIGAD